MSTNRPQDGEEIHWASDPHVLDALRLQFLQIRPRRIVGRIDHAKDNVIYHVPQIVRDNWLQVQRS